MSILLTGDDLIDLAVQTETRGEAFYQQAAAKAESGSARDLFNYLAEQEAQHRETFRSLVGAVVTTEVDPTTWDEAIAYIEATVDRAFFTGKDQPIKTIDSGASLEEMLTQAIAFEQQTLLYFLTLRDLVQPANRPLVDQIANEERSHVRKLAAMRATLDGA
ncbi:MAG: ferritin-like domain-containing protein [Anaerolineae bacterium]